MLSQVWHVNRRESLDLTPRVRHIELTRRGKPIAVVISLREFERLHGERAPFGDAYKRFLKAHPLHEVGLDED